MSQGRSANDGGPQNGAARPLPGPDPLSVAPMTPENASPAGNGPVRRTIRVVNPRGLHPRIIDLFTRTAKRFASEVTIWHGESRGNGKDVWDLIALLVLPDSEVVLEVDGPDADAAVGPLADILGAPGGEDYPAENQIGDGI